MPKKNQSLLNKKRLRNTDEEKENELDINEEKELELDINEEKEKFDLISYKLNKAKTLFNEYNKTKIKQKKWETIKSIIDLVEINPVYNFEFLKMHKDFEKKDYEYDFNQLSPTLSEKDFFSLTKKKQRNSAKVLFDLLKLYIENEKEFEEETKKIIINKYNIPLIEGNEKLRINYYIQLLAHFTLLMNDNQKKYLSNPNEAIDENEIKLIEKLKNKYNNIKDGINFFENLIPKMKNFFMKIKQEEDNFNIKIFTFMLYITDIIQRIINSERESTIISNFFEKEINPEEELLEYNSLDNIIKTQKNSKFPKTFGIRKKYLNESIKKKDKNKDDKINTFVINNDFETREFDGRNYIVKNLINDYLENFNIPLEILLLRNQSLKFFNEYNKNFLNTSEKIFSEFKEYFKFFIKTKCVKEALESDNKYINIEKLIEDKNIINKFLSNKNLKSIPLFEFAGSGYTNKDILISCISGFPFKIFRYQKPKSEKEYKTLKGIIILFNVGMKMIATLHELIIHLCFAYLNYISEGKISHESPKKVGKTESLDGGLLFEQLLFGCQYGNITLNDILVILNGEYLDSLENFQGHLRKEFDSKKFAVKTKLLKLIFEEYNLTLNDLKNNKNVYSTMKSSENEMFIKRDVMNILLPYKAPIAYSYY